MEGDIDIGRSLDAVIRRWRLIVPIIVVCVVLACSVDALRPKQYRARVLIATIKTTTEVSFDTAIKTFSEEQLQPVGSGKQRMASFVALASSAGIADPVLAEIGHQLPEELRHSRSLLRIVDSQLAVGSDLIEIGVTHTDPQIATLMANAWGKEYVRQVNLVYGDVAEEPLLAIQREALSAQGDYDRAQAALGVALRENRTNSLERRVNEVQGVIETLRMARDDELQSLLNRLRAVGTHEDAATDLLAQVQEGGRSAADTGVLALQILKIGAYSGGQAGMTMTLQLDARGQVTGASGMVGDLSALSASLASRKALLEQQVSEKVEQVASPPDGASSTAVPFVSASPDLEQLLRELESELEQAKTDLRKVRTRRDLAQQTYEMLLLKEAELSLASQNLGAEVRLAAPALIAKKEGLSLVYNAAIGAIVGAALGILCVIAAEAWQAYRQGASEQD